MPRSNRIGSIHLNHQSCAFRRRCREKKHFSVVKSDIVIGDNPLSFIGISVKRKFIGLSERSDSHPFGGKIAVTVNREPFQNLLTHESGIGEKTFGIQAVRKDKRRQRKTAQNAVGPTSVAVNARLLQLLRTEKSPAAIRSLSDHMRKRCLKNPAQNGFRTLSFRKSLLLPLSFDFGDQTPRPTIVGGKHFGAQLLQIERQFNGVRKNTAFEVIEKNGNGVFQLHVGDRCVFGRVEILGNRQRIVEIFVLTFHCNDTDDFTAVIDQWSAAVSRTGSRRKADPIPLSLLHFRCITG